MINRVFVTLRFVNETLYRRDKRHRDDFKTVPLTVIQRI